MKPARWSLGILGDRETEQVPGKPQLSFMAREEQLREFSSAYLTVLTDFSDHVLQGPSS